ncbi:ABC transporter substrate-binding protein [Candidatus Auribacterota bacterium]
MYSWIKKYIAFCFLFFLLVSCSSQKRDYETLFLRIKSDPSSLDPAYIVDVTSGSIAAKLYNGLVKLSPEMDIVPDIAKAYDISADGKIYTFFLNQGVKFSHGRELVAADVKYSFERILSPKTASSRKWLFDMIKGADAYLKGESSEVTGIKVLDNYALKIHLDRPFSLFLTFLTMPNAYIVPKEEVAKRGKDFSNRPCGTGPFILKEWKHDHAITLFRNDNYFSEVAKVKGIRYQVIPEDLSAVSLFQGGLLDVIGVPRSEFELFKNNPYLIEQMELNSYYLGFNCSRPPFDKKLVRQAVNMAIDREKMIERLLEGRVVKSHGPIPPGLKGYSNTQTKYSYDVVKAKELLKEAGFLPGTKVKLYQNSDKEVLAITSVVQHYLKEVGIEVEIVQRDWSAFKEAINKGEADLFYLSWWADYPDAENFLFPLFHSKNFGSLGNRVFFKDPRVDQLLEKIHSISNEQERVDVYQQIERSVIDQAPWVFLWHRKSYLVHQPWVKNYKPYPLYTIDKGISVKIRKD